MKKLNVVALIFLSIVAGACSTVSVSTVTAFPTATNTSAVVASTFTVEATSTIPAATLSVVSTIEAIVTEKPELERFYERSCIVSGLCCCVPNLGLSPDGKWAVFFNNIDGAPGLSVVNVNSKKQWNISYYDITGTYGGDTTVEIEHWSQDGRYLYVSPREAGSGGLGYFWRSETELIQLDLADGTWLNTNMGSAFSFSTEDRFIVYRHEQNVVIHEFQTGQERTFAVPSEYSGFGRFVWSPDSQQILFVASAVEEVDGVETSDQQKGFTLFLLNTENMKAQVIIEKDKRYLYPLEWQEPNIVLLESLYQVASDGTLHSSGEKYRLDLGTNDISKVASP